MMVSNETIEGVFRGLQAAGIWAGGITAMLFIIRITRSFQREITEAYIQDNRRLRMDNDHLLERLQAIEDEYNQLRESHLTDRMESARKIAALETALHIAGIPYPPHIEEKKTP